MRPDDALNDLRDGVRMWRLWLRMGWMDVLRRYRRTTIGPFWTTLGVASFVGVSGFMYAGVFGQELSGYLPYISAGFTVWVPLSTFLNECTGAFAAVEATVKQTRLPYTIFILSALVRNAIVFGHHLIVFVCVIAIVGMDVTWTMALALPALILYIVNGVWAGIVVAIVCARFRDLQQVVANLLIVMFFMTPIFWPAESVRGRMQAVLVEYNVLHHFVDILRAPMLGIAPDALSWRVVGVVTVAGWVLAIWLFRRARGRIVFWI